MNNRLRNVTDFVDNNFNNDIKHYTNTAASRYLYDATGNVVKDLVAGQDTIVWNHYNKVGRTRNETQGNRLNFAYDGAGQRYLKQVERSAGDTTLERSDYYVRDAQGNILAVYDQQESYRMTKRQWVEYITTHTGISVADWILKVLKPHFATVAAFRSSLLGAVPNSSFESGLLPQYPVSFFSANAAVRSRLLSAYEQQAACTRRWPSTAATADSRCWPMRYMGS